MAEEWCSTGSVLAPYFITIYVSDLPPTISSKFAYADDLALVHTAGDWRTFDKTISQNMATLQTYRQKLKLNLSKTKTVSYLFHLTNREVKPELSVDLNNMPLPFCAISKYPGVTLDRFLTYRHLESLRQKVSTRVSLIRRLAETTWGVNASFLRKCAVQPTTEYCSPVWRRSAHTLLIDPIINNALRTVTGCLRPKPTNFPPVLAAFRLPSLVVNNHAKTSPQSLGAMSPAPPQDHQPLKSRHIFVVASRELSSQFNQLDIRAAGWEEYSWGSALIATPDSTASTTTLIPHSRVYILLDVPGFG